MNEAEQQALTELLQLLSLHLAGRSVIMSEIEQVCQGGEATFEGLLRTYRTEQLNYRSFGEPHNHRLEPSAAG
ncbi:hypothetical protein [Deinococcus peraridilitoris]|uniref:hypothetical protein n=1 Tax=Deinococcus peraridilitoris TaxID=432329 RepID=UPI00059CC7CE|nr:hypothetical protein [Deinococcus peraridilitoris]